MCVEVTSISMDAKQRQLGASCLWLGHLFKSVFVCNHGDKTLKSHMYSCGLEFDITGNESIAIILNEKFLKVCKGIPTRNPEQPE